MDEPTGRIGGRAAADGHARSTRAVVAAFLANLGIALAKLAGFSFTGAVSMLAEAAHSLADTANQGLLLLGGRRSRRSADATHPFGFGRERYFWAFVVALVLFTGGGLFALLEGEEKLRRPHELESTTWAIGVLLVAIVLEGLSFRTATRASAPARREDESWWAFVRRSKEPELTVVLLEDTGALLGLGFALFGIVMSELTHNPRWDAAGSIAIGLLLVAIAAGLAVKMKSLLIGESASPEQVAAIHAALRATDGLDRVLDLRTEHLGPHDILVVAKVVVRPSANSTEATLDVAERELRRRVPDARLVYLEPEAPSLARRAGSSRARVALALAMGLARTARLG